MKVTDASQIKALAPSKPVEAGGPPAAERASKSDRVSTQDTERVKAAVAEASRFASTGRAAKLQAIETAVRQGTYRPDPQRIAQEILDDAELAARMQALFMR